MKPMPGSTATALFRDGNRYVKRCDKKQFIRSAWRAQKLCCTDHKESHAQVAKTRQAMKQSKVVDKLHAANFSHDRRIERVEIGNMLLPES